MNYEKENRLLIELHKAKKDLESLIKVLPLTKLQKLKLENAVENYVLWSRVEGELNAHE